MFDVGRGHALFLVVACVAGVFLGIGMRIRVFVYLGVIFLVMTALTQVLRRNEERKWLWGVCGLALAAGIFAFVAWAERRNARASERIRSLMDSGD